MGHHFRVRFLGSRAFEFPVETPVVGVKGGKGRRPYSPSNFKVEGGGPPGNLNQLDGISVTGGGGSSQGTAGGQDPKRRQHLPPNFKSQGGGPPPNLEEIDFDIASWSYGHEPIYATGGRKDASKSKAGEIKITKVVDQNSTALMRAARIGPPRPVVIEYLDEMPDGSSRVLTTIKLDEVLIGNIQVSGRYQQDLVEEITLEYTDMHINGAPADEVPAWMKP